MRLKKYIGESMHIALAQAKDELGDEISILESREIKNKHLEDGKGIEITIAVTEEVESVSSSNSPLNYAEEPKPVKNNSPADAYFNNYLNDAMNPPMSDPSTLTPPHSHTPTPSHSHTPTPSHSHTPTLLHPHSQEDLGNEVQILRQELNKLNISLRKIVTTDFPREFSIVYEKLQNAGISKEDVDELVRHAFIRLENVPNIDAESILLSIKPEIDSYFSTSSNIFAANDDRLYTFIGPTGVGKTTAIMKLASNPAILGNKKAGIITTDTYRMAGTESLKVFSKIASVPLIECKNGEGMGKAIRQLADLDIILIDTAGRSPYFPNYIQELQTFIGPSDVNKVILTLSATSDLEDLYLAAGLYTILKPMGIIFNKLDETGRPGKIFSIIKHLGIPPIFLSSGQAVPQDMLAATSGNFWNILNEKMI